MRRVVIKAIILVLVLFSALAGATAGHADESLSPLEIGSPPSCDNEVGACGPPGDHVWCEGVVEGAVFNEGWSVFSEPWGV